MDLPHTSEDDMTRTAAIREARKQVQIYRFGRQWQVETWSEQHNAWRQHHPTDYWRAREHVTVAVASRALELLGIDPIDANAAAEQYEGSAEERVRSALAPE